MNEYELLLIEGYKLRNQEDSLLIQDFDITVSDGLLDENNEDTCSSDATSNNS